MKLAGNKTKILLADDSITMHRAVSLGLRGEPFELLTCDNGDDALRMAREQRPAAVLADIDMPGLTGIELVRAIKADPSLKGVRCVLLCGAFDEINEKDLDMVPADGRLFKPFEAHALTALLGKLLDGRNSLGAQAEVTGEMFRPATTATQPISVKTRTDQRVADRGDMIRDMTEQTFSEASVRVPQQITIPSVSEPQGAAFLDDRDAGVPPKVLSSSLADSPPDSPTDSDLRFQEVGTLVGEDLPEVAEREATLNLWDTDPVPSVESGESVSSEDMLMPLDSQTQALETLIPDSGIDFSQFGRDHQPEFQPTPGRDLEIRSIVREEIRMSFRETLRELLKEELDRVVRELDSER